MPNFICVTCGTQFAESAKPPALCPICTDERQYIGWQGQQWTTLEELRRTHQNRIKSEAPGLTGIGTEPTFAIGQRALLVQTAQGNLLWDCISLLDEATIAAVQALGGIAAIAISHPHYYSAMVEWSRAFDAPIYLHAADQAHIMRPDPAIQLWTDETHTLLGEVTLIRCGGHFAGGTVAHWPSGADGQGILLSGDIVNVVSDRRYVSFMYSYPNLLPLSATSVRRIAATLQPYPFAQIYGAWWDRVVAQDANAVVQRSAERYIAALAVDR